MSKGFYSLCCVLGALCAGIVAFNLFKDLHIRDAIMCLVILAMLFVFSYWRLRIGAVKKEDLEKRKEEIVQAALAAEG